MDTFEINSTRIYFAREKRVRATIATAAAAALDRGCMYVCMYTTARSVRFPPKTVIPAEFAFCRHPPPSTKVRIETD